MLLYLGYLLFNCLGIICLYKVVPTVLIYNENYLKYDDNKQKYIVKNVIKSFILAVLSWYSYILIKSLAYDIPLTNNYVKFFASSYVANDIVGLILIPKLPKSTKFHHIMSSILLFYNYFIDYSDINNYSVAKLLIVYTCFSSFPFLVNMYLGLRFLEYKDDKLTENKIYFNNFLYFIKKASFYIYLVSVSLNWTYQLYNVIMYELTMAKLIYFSVLIPIINDDIVLLKWLKK